MLYKKENEGMGHLLTGIGLGALIGTAAGFLLARKSGDQIVDGVKGKFNELKHKAEDLKNNAEEKIKRG